MKHTKDSVIHNDQASDCDGHLVMSTKKKLKLKEKTKVSKKCKEAVINATSLNIETDDCIDELVNNGVTKKKLKKQKKQKEVIDEDSVNTDQCRNLSPTTDRDISIDETNDCGVLAPSELTKKKLKKPKKQKEAIDEESFHMDQSRNLSPTTNGDCDELVSNGQTKKKLKKSKQQKEVIDEDSFNMNQCRNLPSTTNGDCNELVSNGQTKKKLKKSKKQKEVIDEDSFNMDQCRDLPQTTNGDFSIDEANDCGELVPNGLTKKKLKKSKKQKEVINEKADDCNGDLVTTEVTKKKLKKQKNQTKWQEEGIDEISFNIDSCKNLPPTTDGDVSIDEANDCVGQLVPNGVTKKKLKNKKADRKRQGEVFDEANDCNGELVTEGVTKKKLKKQKVYKERQEEIVDDAPFDIDQCQNPLEHEEHWALRRAFLEKNQHILPQDQLISLAQVYMNVELLGCWYAPETMEIVAKLSEGLGRDYHRARAVMIKPTFVSASDAAICKVRNLNATDVAKNYSGASVMAVAQSTQDTVPSVVLNCLRSDLIIVNQDMQLTLNTFNSLQNGMVMEAYTEETELGECEGIVKVGGAVIAKQTDYSGKIALSKAWRIAKEFLMQYCYSISHKIASERLAGAEVVELSELKKQNEDEAEDKDKEKIRKLDADNVGFKLLAKLGWSGGSLGVRGDGIVDPVKLDHQLNRKGLGMVKTEKPKKAKVDLSKEMIKDMLMDFADGTNPAHQIVFSSDYSKANRIIIHSVAFKMGLKSQSYGKEGRDRRLVVTRKYKLRPTELLRKLLVEKDPKFCQLYNVTPPSELM
uniref:G-patch domain-containing protein n=1 Tax=Anopheles funestus TaxID=62324 RepID=A0A182R767_ANOFN